MKLLLATCVALVMVGGAYAGTYSYGWEDGVGTIMGFYGNLANDVNQSANVNSGSYAMSCQESPVGGTPQAYVAFIEGLADGDAVDVTFYCFDDTDGASPSTRIWAHYANSGDVNSYAGSASGNAAYSDGSGWQPLAWSWLFDGGATTGDAMVIEFRLYSGAEFDTYFCDDITVTAPDGAVVTFAGADPTSTNETTWGSVKGLFR